MRGLRRLVGVGALAGTLAACGGGSSGGGGSGGGSFPGYLPSAAVLANPGGAQDFEFGSAVVWLDWNGDGRPDLVVGSPGQSNGGLAGVGAAVLYLQAPDHSFAFARSFVPSNWAGVTAATGQRFGETLATGDFDGDGLPDLVIGAPGDAVGPNADAGRVYVVFNDVAHTGALVGPIADPTGASTGAEFGSTLATGALNADVRTDLAVGAQGATVSTFAGAGQVVALYGTASQASFGSVVLGRDHVDRPDARRGLRRLDRDRRRLGRRPRRPRRRRAGRRGRLRRQGPDLHGQRRRARYVRPRSAI